MVYQKHTTGNEWALWCSQNFSSIAFDPHDPAQFFSDLRRQYECGGNRHAFDRALENHAQQQAEQQAQRAERAEGADTDTDEEGSSAATHPQFTGYPGTQGIPPGVTIPHPGPGEYE
ncbi:MAG: hypothetical protein KGQ49_05470 [Verrucomicrobia bacterium]|nr:hypothetical protein [Verrucomicrobiota bacterium]MDE3047057.1 hypothetical protein [Verrucomicrobiota bacterium]